MPPQNNYFKGDPNPYSLIYKEIRKVKALTECTNLCDLLKKAQLTLPPTPIVVGDQFPVLHDNNGELQCVMVSFPNSLGVTAFVNTYADLPDPALNPGVIYYVLTSTGTPWWPPGYKSDGFYISDGIEWKFSRSVPINATLAQAIAGTDDVNFITSKVLNDWYNLKNVQVGVLFEDEGVPLGSQGTVDTFNVTGPGATLTRIGNIATLNIPGGGSSGYTVIEIDFTDDPYNFAFTANEYLLLVDCTLGDVNVNLPTAVGNQVNLTIVKIDSTLNKVLVNALGLELINGDSTYEILFQNSAMGLKSTNLNWRIV